MSERSRRFGGGSESPVWAPAAASGLLGRAAARVLCVAAALAVAATAAFAPAFAAPRSRPAPRPAARPAARPPSPESCSACFGASDPLACHLVAVDLAARRSFDRAIAIEERVHAREPKNAEVAAALARMHHLGTKNSARAIALYHAALYASPGYPPALLGLGQIMEDAGELEIASRYFARGARERPDMALFKVRLAAVLIRIGRDGEAQPVLQEIVDRWPGSPEADSARKMMSRTALARP